MQQFDIFFLPSEAEALPVVLMESMACGLVPVCYIGEGGINEIIKDGVNGFVVKDRDQDYQEKLRLLQKDPELWKRMSANAIKTIEEKYSAEITHKKWATLLIELLENKTTPLIIPKKIILDAEPLIYEENRKPILIIRFKINLKRFWMKFRLAVRPRARLRELINQIKKHNKQRFANL